ncbi:hypothetical protein [Nitrosomonas halophila]|uniref:Uncharacterized protein n=1 Tax=Nitrosomonas halophila TaxID=44576 RepID=A0A1H3N669_9PROT|nr:hypothetical protein [Nitrosomonas halophila]SDY84318.1 hypothetical protein SAMN05421881_106812 [Nitrosomonas halophila]
MVWNEVDGRLEFSDAAGRGFSEVDFAVTKLNSDADLGAGIADLVAGQEEIVGQPSDSFFNEGAGFDIITNFQIDGTDELQLGYGNDILADGVYDDIAAIEDVANGIVTFNAGTTTLEEKLTAVFEALADSNDAAAFVFEDNTYVVQGDGVTGMQDTDIVVQLAGVADLTDVVLGDILI